MHRFLAFTIVVACSSDAGLHWTVDEKPPTDPTTPPTTPPQDPTSTPPETTPSPPGPLADLAFFQAVEVPVFRDGAAVATLDRTAPIVTERDAILRARVRLDEPADDLELALDLTVDGTTETFLVTGREDDLILSIPAESMAEDATYVVHLFDGTTLLDRFPDTGEADLDAMVTGPLAVTVVPFEVHGLLPDTSDAIVEGYRAALMAMYPVTDVRITVRQAEVWDGIFDISALTIQLGVIQENELIAGLIEPDEYYYGMVNGDAVPEMDPHSDSFEDGGSNVLERAYFATGLAYGDQASEDTFVHAIGHIHRLGHAPCDGEGDLDPSYPYPPGTIGVNGFDVRTGAFVSTNTPDLMSFCAQRSISDYSYGRLAKHVANAQDYQGFPP